MSETAMNAARMIDMLPDSDQHLAYELIKKLVLAWDPDFTKLTPEEAKLLNEAENDEFVDAEDIDWSQKAHKQKTRNCTKQFLVFASGGYRSSVRVLSKKAMPKAPGPTWVPMTQPIWRTSRSSCCRLSRR